VASATLPGLTATLARNGPGIFDTGAWPDVRVFMQTSAQSIRAACSCDGRSLDRTQSFRDVVIQPAGTPGVWRDFDAAEMLILNISPRFLRETAAGLGLNPDRTQVTPRLHARDDQIEHIGLALKAAMLSDAGLQPLYGESLGVALAARLLDRFAAEVPTCRQALSTPQRRRVIDYIDAHLDDDLSLRQLAAVARISVPHFTVLFRRSMGRSAHRYVLERRVEAARARLMAGGMTIAEVALETGFAHQSHMSRCMRRLTGLTPGEILRCR
jgi:AraC family transcriptional regulator